jgi:hypothetical protein
MFAHLIALSGAHTCTQKHAANPWPTLKKLALTVEARERCKLRSSTILTKPHRQNSHTRTRIKHIIFFAVCRYYTIHPTNCAVGTWKIISLWHLSETQIENINVQVCVTYAQVRLTWAKVERTLVYYAPSKHLFRGHRRNWRLIDRDLRFSRDFAEVAERGLGKNSNRTQFRSPQLAQTPIWTLFNGDLAYLHNCRTCAYCVGSCFSTWGYKQKQLHC